MCIRDSFHSEIKQILLLSIAGLMTAVSFASIFTLISAISQHKAAIEMCIRDRSRATGKTWSRCARASCCYISRKSASS